jgi:hypothetical protein
LIGTSQRHFCKIGIGCPQEPIVEEVVLETIPTKSFLLNKQIQRYEFLGSWFTYANIGLQLQTVTTFSWIIDSPYLSMHTCAK